MKFYYQRIRFTLILSENGKPSIPLIREYNMDPADMELLSDYLA